jgi:large subunit ribosomal protein L21
MTYAIIALGGKQHRVSEGERLIVDRVAVDEGKTFKPTVLLAGDGDDVEVTVRVVKHDLGPKIRIGKYRPKKGYKRHNGHRSRVTQIEIEAIAAKGAKPARKTTKKAAAEPPAEPAEPASTEELPTAEGATTEETVGAEKETEKDSENGA